jgi:hypothetical protein
MSTTEPSPANDLVSLFAEYERSAGTSIPHYRQPNEIRSRGEAADSVVAANGQPLVFSRPPLAPEPGFEERLEPLLQPLREQVTAAETMM